MHEFTLEFIRNGSSKDILRVDSESLAFRFTNDFSVFDVGRAPYGIPGKAKAICMAAVKSFEIARVAGIPTNFIEQLDEVTIRVREARIITDRPLTIADENYMVPAEWIDRQRVSGSILRDFKSGKKKPGDYGLPAGVIPAEGTLFPRPTRQFTTKYEAVDRDITFEETCAMAALTTKDVEEYWTMIEALNAALGEVMLKAGFYRFDGKKECIMGPGRVKMIGDVFGTQDEDRPCKMHGDSVIHYSKEHPRQLFIDMGYKEEVDQARVEGRPVPPIPMLSEEDLTETSRRYMEFAEAYAGVKI